MGLGAMSRQGVSSLGVFFNVSATPPFERTANRGLRVPEVPLLTGQRCGLAYDDRR